MLDDEFLEGLWVWCDKVLNRFNDVNTTIIFGEQNAPRPQKPYLVIHRPVNARQLGHADADNPNATGIRPLYFHYTAMVSFEAVGLGTDYIRFLLDSVYLQEYLDLFKQYKITFLRSENIIAVPDLQEDSWEVRNVVDMHFLYAYSITENTNYIEEFQYTNNI